MSQSLIYISSQRLPTGKAYGLQITKMCEAFGIAGLAVELLVPTRRNSDPCEIFNYYGIRQNFTITVVPSPDFYFPGIFDRVAFVIKQWIAAIRLVKLAVSRNADSIFSRDELPIFLASFYRLRSQLVFEAHRFSHHRRWIYRRFKNNKVKIIAISKGVRDQFIACGYAPQNIVVTHDGVDLEEFKNLPDTATARVALNLPPDKKIVMYIGQLLDWKGVDILVRAAAFIGSDTLIFIGGGTSGDIARLKKIDTTGRVRFEGPTPFRLLPQYLRAADILVLPNKKDGDISEFYTSPLKLFAYMAAERPIVASDLPSLREILHEKNSVLVTPNNPQSLAGGIQRLLDDTNQADALRHQAFLDVVQYTWQARVAVIQHFLNTA